MKLLYHVTNFAALAQSNRVYPVTFSDFFVPNICLILAPSNIV